MIVSNDSPKRVAHSQLDFLFAHRKIGKAKGRAASPASLILYGNKFQHLNGGLDVLNLFGKLIKLPEFFIHT